MYSRIIGTGSYLPEKILTNRDLEQTVETSDEWIRSRTGITQRHIAAAGQTASDMAFDASKMALDMAKIKVDEIDLIIVATTTPDMIFPSTACFLQEKLGIKDCPAFDVQAVCSGFVYALATADMYLRAGNYRKALVVGSEIYSNIVDWNDRTTCVLFGDGAGAVVLSAIKSCGQIYMQAVLSCPMQPSHFSVITKLGIGPPHDLGRRTGVFSHRRKRDVEPCSRQWRLVL